MKAEISEHRQLLNDISKEVPADSVNLPMPQSREELINNTWKMLDMELAEKKCNLEDFSRTKIKVYIQLLMLIRPFPIIVAFAFNGACKLGNVVTIVTSSNVNWPYGNVCDAK